MRVRHNCPGRAGYAPLALAVCFKESNALQASGAARLSCGMPNALHFAHVWFPDYLTSELGPANYPAARAFIFQKTNYVSRVRPLRERRIAI